MSYNKLHRGGRKKMGLGGEVAGGALKGAATGAAMGSVIPVWGTAVGAAVGAVAGGVGSFVKGKKREKLQDIASKQQLVTQEAGDYFADLSALQAFDNQYNGAFGLDMNALGGNNPNNGFNIDVEPTQIASDVNKIEGPDHTNGGVGVDADLDGLSEVELEGGEIEKQKRVYSKRLKVPQIFIKTINEEGFTVSKGSYAKVAESLGNSKNKYEEKLQSFSKPEVNTAMLMLERIENLFDNLFYTQEFSKLDKEQ